MRTSINPKLDLQQQITRLALLLEGLRHCDPLRKIGRLAIEQARSTAYELPDELPPALTTIERATARQYAKELTVYMHKLGGLVLSGSSIKCVPSWSRRSPDVSQAEHFARLIAELRKLNYQDAHDWEQHYPKKKIFAIYKAWQAIQLRKQIRDRHLPAIRRASHLAEMLTSIAKLIELEE